MTERSTLPPLKSLVAAEAVIRNKSVAKAANELNLTPSAISQQLRVLEGAMKLSLFKRSKGRVDLKPEYENYFKEITRSLDIIQAAGNHLKRAPVNMTLTVSVVPSFASLCLLPVLHEFSEHNPSVQLNIISSLELANFGTDDLDLSIRYTADTSDKSLIFEKLRDDYLFPCASKTLIEKAGTDELEQLSNDHFLLDDVSKPLLNIKPGWHDWLPAVGEESSRILGFSDYQHVVQAALNDQGLFIARTGVMTEPGLNDDFVALSDKYLRSGASFYLVHSAHIPLKHSTRLFKTWLHKRFADTSATADQWLLTNT